MINNEKDNQRDKQTNDYEEDDHEMGSVSM